MTQLSDRCIGTVTLTNTKHYPFNDSVRTVALETPMANADYDVLTEVVSAVGETGDIVVSGKAVNGFKLAFTGSAPKAVIRYRVVGEAGSDAAGSNGRECLPYKQTGTVFSFDGGALTLDLSDEERDYPVTLDISADGSGRLVLGPAHRYIAQVDIPARAYTIDKGAADDFGFPQLKKTAVPLDTDKVTLTLWAADETEGRYGRFDDARFALEAATGGMNTLLPDDTGMPSVMVRIPSFKWSDVYEDGEDKVCSAFIVGGETKDCIYISKFLNIIENDRAYSLPYRDPAHTISIDEARAACARKGRGWHLMSNTEWMAIAHWSRKNGTLPHGNSNAGRDINAVHEHGVVAPSSGIGAGHYPEVRTLTGSGPSTWSHDWTSAGIYDLCGNVWDMVSGLRLVGGALQVIPDNDSAMNVDESAASPLWRAIDTNGNLVAPGSPNTYKYDGVHPGTQDEDAVLVPGGVRLSTAVMQPQYTGSSPEDYKAWTMMPFRSMTSQSGVTPHVLLKELGLFPLSEQMGDDNFFVRNYGERMPLRGGSWLDGKTAGLWELYLRDSRTWIFPDVGFRSAFVYL